MNNSVCSMGNIYKVFGDLNVVNGISIEIKKGDVTAIIGPSGSGKSTLLRCLNCLETINSGEISIDGETMVSTDDKTVIYAPKQHLEAMRRKLGLVFQSFNLFPHMSVLKNVMLAPEIVQNFDKKEAESKAISLLERVGLIDKISSYPFELSGGQKQRVAIARALALEPKLLCFDEPTSALDPELTIEVLKAMQNLASDGITMLVVTHEMKFAENVATNVVFMDSGRIVEQGTPDEIFHKTSQQRTKDFLGHFA